MFAGARKLGIGIALLALMWLPIGIPSAAKAQIFNLCAAAGSTVMPDGVSVPIWGFGLDTGSGCAPQLPGPVLDVVAGAAVTVNLTNQLTEAVSIVFPGQSLTPDYSGAPPAGATSYNFTASNPGTFLYESGTNPGVQLPMGLYGALIVRPATPNQAYDDPSTGFDSEAVLVLGELDDALNTAIANGTFGTPGAPTLLDYAPKYWLINGKAYPDTDLITAAAGNRLLLRYVNPGSTHHTMTLLGMHQRVIAKDAFPLDAPFSLVAETIPSGQTSDMIATVPAGAADGTRFALYNRQFYLNTGMLLAGQMLHDVGGMLTFVEIGSGPPPIAVVALNDSYVVGSTLTVVAPGVLGNDTHSLGQPLTAVLMTAPTHHVGTFALNADGSFTYTADASTATSDSFTYKATDGTVESTIATVALTINRAPAITSTPPTTAANGQAFSYDVDATDPNADALTYALNTAPAGMTIDSASGLIAWTPTSGQVGSHNVTVHVSDPGGLIGIQSFTVTVSPTPGVHVSDLDGATVRFSSTRWSATVTIRVHDANHNPVANATAQGAWSASGLGATTSCITDGSGSCTVASGRIFVANVTYTVNSVAHTDPYQAGNNHDPDGDSNGTSITLARPAS